MNFSRFLDIQSWWEVPSIAYFCSLFRTAFNLLDFDIEELEEALLTDGTEESASSLLTELIVRLLNGCLGNNDISAFNYQMYLRRLFRRKCQETGRYNPFNTDIDFQFLPLRTKVEILYALCDFRLDAEDVFDLFKNLEAESLRVEPLGYDDNDSAYWYFYGTRLYREDITKKSKGKSKKKKLKENRKRGWFYGDEWLDDDETERVWQVVCFTEEDWAHLTEKFSKATSKVEKELYRSLSQNFLPEIPRLFQEKERLQRKRLLELAPRRTSSRVLQKIKQKEEEIKQVNQEINKDDEDSKETRDLAREKRAKKRDQLRIKSHSSESEEAYIETEDMSQKNSKQSKSHDKRPKNSSSTHKGEPPPEICIKTGRKTNNSLASATGQILIPENIEPVNSTRKKLKTSQIFSQSEEDIQTDMYKVFEQLIAHEDAWPFKDPVEEDYAPNYYTVIRRPMDLNKMEERLDHGYYTDFSMFKADFKLIVNNCRLYNGQDNEYTLMVDNLQAAFDRLTEKYIHRISSSDEEIAVEYQIPTPSRKHKLKSDESPNHQKKKKRKYNSDTVDRKLSSEQGLDGEDLGQKQLSKKKLKESHKSKQSKGKKKRKGHHRHNKHSKNHKKDRKDSNKSDHVEGTKNKHNKKQKHAKDKESKKMRQKKKKNKHQDIETNDAIKRSESNESLESSFRSRSASPLPSIHTPTPSPTEPDPPESQLQHDIDSDFLKDKYDKIKERRRYAAKDAWDSLFDYKQKSADKQKQNLNIPEKDKNQKLRETIEKLKAKNEKYKDNSVFSKLFSSSQNRTQISDSDISKQSSSKENEKVDASDDESNQKQKVFGKNSSKKNSAKNESASEALEQAVKDISKWLDDAPKTSTASSPCDSPAQTISTEEQDNSRLDDEFFTGEKGLQAKKDITRKRPSSKDTRIPKRREIQRTIDRLQPGKSKGNLITNMNTKSTEKIDEVVSLTHNKVRDINKGDDSSHKLSLGSVLPTVEFTLGNDHNFTNNEDNKVLDSSESSKVPDIDEGKEDNKDLSEEVKITEESVQNKKDVEVETEPTSLNKLSQEKATPNLSAWFKAFGAPKSSTSSTISKKKTDEVDIEEKPDNNNENKVTSPKPITKYDNLIEPETPNPDGGESPLTNIVSTPRQRRTSTGSSISERSSFSQDLDSPRHQMSHTSPLLQSPASPRTEDFQKITYPIINGTVRAGFYQDTTSIKSSPEKSCSPREAPLSPYSPYSQHVYASNSATGAATPNYFADHNKSPLPTYSPNPPPYYDTSKAPVKSTRVTDDYTSVGPDLYSPQNTLTTSSPYTHSSVNFHEKNQPLPISNDVNVASTLSSTQVCTDPKNALYPVKKRTYNESDNPGADKTATEIKDTIDATSNIKQTHCMTVTTASSIIETATVLNNKSEISINKIRDNNVNYVEQPSTENRDMIYEHSENAEQKKEFCEVDINQPIGMIKKDGIDMVNMGYMKLDSEQRCKNDTSEEKSVHKEVLKTNNVQQPKGYEVDAIAINLGLNNTQIQKSLMKSNIPNIPNVTPAHSRDRQHGEVNITQNITNAHQNQYDVLTSGQSIGNFSLNDIELANKKLYSCGSTPSSTAIDYGNWKMTNPNRKSDIISPEYCTSYSTTSDKTKCDVNIPNLNYNKNIQHQQYHNYGARTGMQRTQEHQQNLSSELRIPNPRGLLKNDMIPPCSSINTNEYLTKSVDTVVKHNQKSDKITQNHPLVNSVQYKTPYSGHSSLQMDGLRNLPNIPQMLERYTNNERYLSTFSAASSSLYNDKTYQMAQMFNKSTPSEVLPSSTSSSLYSQSSLTVSKDNNIYKSSINVPITQTDTKTKSKRKRTVESKQSQIMGTTGYHTTSCATDVLSSAAKNSMMAGNAFNFGTTTNMALSGSLYSDNSGFSIEDFRNSTNQLMAANYMAAAVAHQQQQHRNSNESTTEKVAKPAHQNTSHTPGSFPFIGHSQVRAGYPFVGTETSPQIYQQYLQRQEELLRQTGAQIMGLYPPGYHATLGVRQPYDRPSWL